jgi:hypothetical protein
MSLLKLGAGLLSSSLEAAHARRIDAQLEELERDSPKIRISQDIDKTLGSMLNYAAAYSVLLANIEHGVYAADKELLVGDALATLARLYPESSFTSVEETTVDGRRKNRIRAQEEVIEGLTTLLLDNWEYVSDHMKHHMELFVAYAVYMAGKVAEKTHSPPLLGGKPEPNMALYGMSVMIVLDCIARLEQLNRSRNIIVSKYRFEIYSDDEIAYIRSKLKPPKDGWQRGQYDWSKHSDSCWVVTAYYGTPYHANVEAIKGLRSSLLAQPLLGPTVDRINNGYHLLGRSAFGQWWKNQLAGDSHANLPRLLSAVICRILLWLTAALSSQSTPSD